MGEVKLFYRRNLPHYQPDNATFFVTFRFTGSLPQNVIINLMREDDRAKRSISTIVDRSKKASLLTSQRKRYFGKFDRCLDCELSGESWLRNAMVAQMLTEAMHKHDGNVYDLIAYCIMPNHIHMVFVVKRSDTSLYKILQSLKAYTARSANKILHREGTFWLHESYDHVVRGEKELERIIWYVLNNPVKASLVKKWHEWPWLYCRPDIVEQFSGQPGTDNFTN